MNLHKKHNILKLFIFFTLFITILSCSSILYATSETPDVASPSCILMEYSTGKILYEKNSDEVMYPASTTKVMTAILTLENCEMSDIVTISHNAVFSIPSGYSTATLQVGEQLTVEQLLNVLLIPSANDAAVALAEYIAGSVESFSSMMNTKAIEIGCKNTHFVNPNGIHDEEHVSTAYDLALIGRYALQFPEIKEIVAKTEYTLPITNAYDKEDRIFRTTNSLIKEDNSTKPSNYYYEYATGLKTGYTDPAGHCIISSAEKDGVTYIATVLGGEISKEDLLDQRFLDCKKLFEFAFNNYSVKSINKSGDVIDSIVVPNATEETKNLKNNIKDDINLLLDNDTSLKSITPTLDFSFNIDAPIQENTILGTATYTIDGVSYSSEILSANSVERVDFMPWVFRIVLGIFIILFAMTVFKPSKKSKRKGNYRKKSNHRKRK